MLRAMGLQQYEQAFQGVTGAAMCQLTEQSLENELGVKSKLHRIRLMKITEGKCDVRQLFS